MSDKTWAIFWGMLALAAALVVSCLIAASTFRQVKFAEDTISVTGSARKAIRSDYMKWTADITERGVTRQEAFKAVKRYTERVKGYLKERQIPEGEVVFKAISATPLYDTQKIEGTEGTRNILTGYEVAQSFEIASDKVDLVTDLSGKITDLIAEGIPLTSYPPEYYYTKMADLRVQMMGEAMKDALQRATVLAENAGAKAGVLRSVQSGVFQITPRYSTDVSDSGMNDITALDKDVTAVVKATFAMK